MLDLLSEMPHPRAVIIDGELIGSTLELRSIIQPLDIRLSALKNYLKSVGLDETISVTVLDSVQNLLSFKDEITFLMFEGPCCAEVKSQILSARTHNLNVHDRFELLKPVRAQDGEPLSSARIRMGAIDREGRRLRGTGEPPRRLEFSGRASASTPKGEIYHVRDGPPEIRVVERLRSECPPRVLTVGDVTSVTVISQGYLPDICIIDGITKRGEFKDRVQLDREYRIFNPPAVIYPESWSVIDTALHDTQRSVIVVEGEEDLLGFPAVILAPEGSVMLYGEPNAGIVWVPVDDKNKALARTLLEQMPVIV